jgi:hypothetical protein
MRGFSGCGLSNSNSETSPLTTGFVFSGGMTTDIVYARQSQEITDVLGKK